MHLSGESVDFGDDLQTAIAFDFVLNQIELDAAKYASKVQRNSVRKGRRGNPNFKKGNPNPYYEAESSGKKSVGGDNSVDNCERHNCADYGNNVGIMSINEDNSERDAKIIGIIENRGVSSDFCEIKDNSIYNDNENDNDNENENENGNDNENEKENNIKIKKLIYDDDDDEKEIIKKKDFVIVVDNGFIEDFFKDKGFIESLSRETECSVERLRYLAEAALQEWRAAGKLKHRDYTDAHQHLTSHLRIKVAKERAVELNRKQKGDSVRREPMSAEAEFEAMQRESELRAEEEARIRAELEASIKREEQRRAEKRKAEAEREARERVIRNEEMIAYYEQVMQRRQRQAQERQLSQRDATEQKKRMQKLRDAGRREMKVSD